MLKQWIETVLPTLISLLELMGIFVVAVSAAGAFIRYVKGLITHAEGDVKFALANGLAIGLEFKMAAEMTGGSFEIASQVGSGTKLRAVFRTDHIDCMPLGDVNETIHTLVTLNEGIDFVYTRRIDDRTFTLDTRELREILGDIPFSQPEVAAFLREYIVSNAPEEAQA